MISNLSLVALAALAFATLAGFAGAWGWLLDLCAHFRPQYAIAALLLAVWLLILRRKRAALIALLLLAANLVPIVPRYLPARPVPVKQKDMPALRVMSANIYKGNSHRDRIVDYARRENPDVLILLEVTKGWVKPLEPLNRKYPFRWIRPGDVFAGIAVYSRYTPVETRIFDLAGAGSAAFLVTVELGGKDRPQRLSILGAHLKSPTDPAYFAQRNHQLKELARIAREHTWPLLVMGDFNISPFSPLFGRMLRDGGLKSCTGQALQPTWPVQFPPMFITIDHCLATSSVRTWDFRVGPDVGSDHFPISISAQPAPR